MVKKHIHFNRRAFTMIELIFAIVVIAISIISLPRMIQATSEGISSNIIQEGIFATGALLNESTTYYWDAHSMDDNMSESRVINTGDCTLGGPPYSRIGHINRQCLDDNNTLPNTIANPTTSIETAETTYANTEILTGNPASATYKEKYFATVDVNYCKDGGCVQFGNEVNNPNLKEIEIKIKKADSPNDVIILRAYTANIGEVIPKKEAF